jgi:hypothetical protein
VLRRGKADGFEGTNQQDGSQRCPRHRADDAGGALSPRACKDAAQPETAHAAYASSLAKEIESQYGRAALEGLQKIGFKFEDEPITA